MATKRMYESIWRAVQSTRQDEEVPVRCHNTAVDRIIQAVRKEKTAEVALRRKLNLPRERNLLHRVELDKADSEFCIIYFKLEFNERNI